MIRIAAAVLFLATVTACTSGTSTGPSLLPRAVERQSFDEPEAAPAPAVAADPALDARIAVLIARRQAANAEFARDDQRVAAALAGGAKAAPGTDAWLDAQTALGALDAGRASILDVLTELEALASARAAELQPPYPALDAAQTETEAELARIAAVVAARKAALPL